MVSSDKKKSSCENTSIGENNTSSRNCAIRNVDCKNSANCDGSSESSASSRYNSAITVSEIRITLETRTSPTVRTSAVKTVIL